MLPTLYKLQTFSFRIISAQWLRSLSRLEHIPCPIINQCNNPVSPETLMHFRCCLCSNIPFTEAIRVVHCECLGNMSRDRSRSPPRFWQPGPGAPKMQFLYVDVVLPSGEFVLEKFRLELSCWSFRYLWRIVAAKCKTEPHLINLITASAEQLRPSFAACKLWDISTGDTERNVTLTVRKIPPEDFSTILRDSMGPQQAHGATGYTTEQWMTVQHHWREHALGPPVPYCIKCWSFSRHTTYEWDLSRGEATRLAGPHYI